MTISDDDLHAYVDGALAPGRRGEVEDWLAAHPDDARRVHQWREQVDGLHRLFDPVLDEAVPNRLTAQRRPLAPVLARLAASVLLLAAGAAGGWWLRGAESAVRPPVAAEALAAHVVFAAEIRHPVEVAASDHAHLVGWLSKRLGTPLRTPDLRAAGFSLVGGRLLPASAGPAAQFMYEDGSGQRVTLYLRQAGDSGATAFRYAAQGTANAFYWIDNGFAFAIAGTVPRQALQPLAHEVYRQMAEAPRPG